ncbi:hypothetical protein [Hymenobacter sp. UYCo722]|uniref:hypothetical protein n=1 Tax=Hymenobacter sp. UYCo722 TaxID=3156335 RepID=UPI003392A85B
MLTLATAMRHLRCLLLLLLAGLSLAHAQEAAKTDVILRIDGSEVAGRVLTISPLVLCYLPPAGTDTLRLAIAEVFLVRYANGTREMLHPVSPSEKPRSADLLPDLSAAQRSAKGRQDAARSYSNNGPFWGSLGATIYGGPLLGVVAPAIIAPHAIATANLKAPQPGLLADPAYGQAYRAEAQRRKRGRAWSGYGVGAGMWVALIGGIVAGLQ